MFDIESTTAGNQQLRCIAQNSPTEFNQKLNQLSVSQRGPKPYVPNIELQIFASMVDMQDKAGYGMDKRQVRERAAHLVRDLGTEMLPTATDEPAKKRAKTMMETQTNQLLLQPHSCGIEIAAACRIWQRIYHHVRSSLLPIPV